MAMTLLNCNSIAPCAHTGLPLVQSYPFSRILKKRNSKVGLRMTITYSRLVLGGLILCSPFWLSLQATAQSEGANQAETAPTNAQAANTYTPAYFEQFQPNTARDMISRVPGFTLQGGNNNGGSQRGFGQASLNILINGRRPSSKSSDARDILGRIPANTVERIEILDGASLDIPGLSGQVANVVTSNTSKLSGNWEYQARFEEGTHPQLLEAELSVSGTRGNLEYVASLESDHFAFNEDGVEQFFDGNGVLFEDRTENPFFEFSRPKLDINLTWTPSNGHVANLNFSGGVANRRNGIRETFTAITPAGTTGQSLSNSGEDEIEYEIGGDYAFPLNTPLGAGTLKLIGLHRFEDSDFGNTFRLFEDGEAPFTSIFNNQVDEGEYIFRPEYNWKSGSGADWQLSWEGAFNFLDSTTEFSDNDTALTTENVRVEELRTEGNLTYSRSFTDKLSLQASLGAEFSQLDVPTANEPARKFFRPKGFLSASYDMSPRYTVRARIDREVGQLNFFTFVSSVNLTEDTTSGGNIEIVPDQTWGAELELERKDSKAVSGTVKLFANLIEDPIDRILFPDGSEGPGNLDSALEYGIELSGTWVMDSIGLKGMRLEFEGVLQESEIDDPVTGVTREINDSTRWRYEANLTHDIPNTPWAWRVGVEQFRENPFFRLDQSFDFAFDKPFSYFNITHKDVFGLKVTAGISNLLNWKAEREREIFEPNRNGLLVERQEFARQRGRRFNITVSDTF